MIRKLTALINAALTSSKFFPIVVGLLILQAAWIALSARYPLAFDENFHFGIIQLFSHQWGPYFSSTPPDSGAYGALTRDPSYLYHYLMSFPYRLIASVVHAEAVQIILLRFINIALFGAGLVAFRHLLSQLTIPHKLINFSLLMLVLIPAVPFLAAHINYDNLLFLLLPISLSLTLSCTQRLQSHQSLPIVRFSLLVITLLLTSLVKYVFLPIAVVIVVYLGITLLRELGWRQVPASIIRSFRSLKWPLKVALLIGLVISSGLFIERYGVNIIQYKDFAPDCAKIESFEHCSQYGPWIRNYHYTQDMQLSPRLVDPNLISFSGLWVFDLLYRLFFAINYDYSNKPPLILPFGLAIAMTISSLLAMLVTGVAVLRRYRSLLLPLGATALYAASLFYKNYQDYLAYGERVAVNGRYFIPLLPIILVFAGLAVHQLLQRLKHYGSKTQAIFASLLIVIMLQGGGVLTFIVLSDRNWYWDNPVVITINHIAQSFVSPLIFQFDYSTPIMRLLLQ